MNEPDHRHMVRQQISHGLLMLLILLALGYTLLPTFAEEQRHRLLAGSLLIAVVPLFLAITAVILGRYRSAALIQGPRAHDARDFASAFLQNTQEQTLVSAITLVALSLSAPTAFMQMALVQAACFAIGRLWFFLGYRQDPMLRFGGFVLGWYAAGLSFFASLVFLFMGGV